MKAVYTTGQVADLCHCAPRTVAKWIDKGLLKGYKLPGSSDRRVLRANLIEFMKSLGLPTDRVTADEHKETT